jgi:hypothetical protein
MLGRRPAGRLLVQSGDLLVHGPYEAFVASLSFKPLLPSRQTITLNLPPLPASSVVGTRP